MITSPSEVLLQSLLDKGGLHVTEILEVNTTKFLAVD
jgi:hypothetical protein